MRAFWKSLLLVSAMGMLIAQAFGPAFGRTPPKSATEATRMANALVYRQLPFADTQDFEDAQRGFIGRPETLTIRDATGKPVWDLESYKRFITLDAEAPETVNPSLWRISRLNMLYGLFQVTDRIYQVRGYDISNITFIRGDTGWIVMDPLVTTETARAALDLVTEHLGERPITGIIYSHPHVDHYGGARGIVDEAAAAQIPIVAPEGFLEHAIRENVIAGNAMSRRAMYMFGPFLPRNAQGGVGSGLGMTISNGSQSLIPPTISIETTGQELIIDGVRMVFQMTPDTEAPVEMNTWFPDQKAMWMAENITATMHNILTLRGAQVRDALGWAWYLNEAIELFGPEMEVVFQSHHWPVWGNARAVDKLRKHRDIYKYMHDQTVNLMNKGYTGEEIAEMLELPEELERNWSTRGYYGTLRHNVRAVYQRYMGWYDGNPANLNNLPPVQAARKYVEYMGGEAAIVQRARADFEQGEYRWVAEVLKHVVYANPDNREARELQADAFEQMGYQAESGPWRSVYLQAALELRDGIPDIPGRSGTFSPDVIRAMTPEMLFDYMAVRLNASRAAGRTIRMNITLTGLPREVQAAYGLTVENAVLNYGRPLGAPDAGLTLDKTTLEAIILGDMTMEEAVARGLLVFTGRPEALAEFMSLLDTFPALFPIVTPREAARNTRIGLVNLGGTETARNVLRGFNATGNQVWSRMLSLPAHGRLEINLSHAAGAATPEIKSLRLDITGTGSRIVGYQTLTQSNTSRAMVEATPRPSRTDLFLPHIASSQDWWTGIGWLNTTAQTRNLSLTFDTGQNAVKMLGPLGQDAFTIADLFGGIPQPDISTALVAGSSGMAGLLFLGDAQTLAGIALSDATATTLHFPHVAEDEQWWSGFVVANPGSRIADLTLVYRDASGNSLGAGTARLDAGRRLVATPESLNLPRDTAWFSVHSSQPVTGFQLIGTQSGKQLAGYAVVNLATRTGAFPKLDRNGWTGIALVNPGSEAARIQVQARDDAGRLVAGTTLDLAAGWKWVDQAPLLFPDQDISAATFITFTSSREVIGLQVSGSRDGTMLDAVPALGSSAHLGTSRLFFPHVSAE